MIVIDRDPAWILELAWLVAFLAELRHERSPIIIARERLDSMVVVLDEEQEASMMVERQAGRAGEWASCHFTNRELDSSIIVEITFHLIQEKRLQPSTQENRHKRERWYCTRGGVCDAACAWAASKRANQPTNQRPKYPTTRRCFSVLLSLSLTLVYLSYLLAFVPSSSAIANSHSLSKVKISLL